MIRRLLASTALSLVSAGLVSGAYAQDTGAAAGKEEVIVTAQKRSQALQDVPVSVTAISGETIARAAITNVQDLQVSTPGLGVVSTNRPGTGTGVRLRGVGTGGNDAGLEGSIAFSVDGVYRIRSGSSLGDFVDVERVEVLRGPQGTLFGKNTSAGVISVTNRKPVNEFEGFAEGTLGNYDLKRFRGAINIPLIDEKLAFRAALGMNKRDGYIEDVASGATYNDRDRFSVSGKLRFTPSDNFDWTITVDYARADEHCCAIVAYSQAPGAVFVPFLAGLAAARGTSYAVNPDPLSYKTSLNGPLLNSNKDLGFESEMEWSLDDSTTLTLISSYRKFDDYTYNDTDFGGADLSNQTVTLGLKVHSEEIRLQGTEDSVLSGLDWLIGAYYSSEKIVYTEDVHTGADQQATATFLSSATVRPLVAGVYPEMDNVTGQRARSNGESYAIFTHNILNVTDDFRVIAGLRYSSDSKSGVGTPYAVGLQTTLPRAGLLSSFIPNYGFDTEFKDDAVTGTLVLNYDFADDVMGYVSYSRGYKSGGFAMARESGGRMYSTVATCSASRTVVATVGTTRIYQCDPNDSRFESETVDSYEIGLRSQFFDKALTLNLTGFWAKYDNLQVNTYNGIQFVLSNAGSATTRGIELETRYVTPIEGLTLGGTLSWLDARYGDKVGVLTPGEPSLGGTALGGASKWSGSATIDYSTYISESARLYARAEYAFSTKAYTSTRVSSTGGELILPGYDTTNFVLGLDLDNGVDISAYCRNCFDDRRETFVTSSPGQAGMKIAGLAPPLEYGLTIRTRF